MRLYHGTLACLLAACLVRDAAALTVTPIAPTGYQTAIIGESVPCYADGSGLVISIPPALAGGTLLRTHPADAAKTNLLVQFAIDLRSEVYVCYDSRGPVASWLSSWVATGMTMDVDGQAGVYRVYAKRFAPGTVTLPANTAPAMYFVVVKASVPVLPRCGWVLLSYDMPYLREIIKQAPEYNVNHLQLSHDLVMFTYQVLNQPGRRADLNELIDLAHAYGVSDVTLWTHEVATVGMPDMYFSGGDVDGDNPGMWEWVKDQYRALFSPATGCPDLDGIVLTFSELSMTNEGVEVWDRGMFKHEVPIDYPPPRHVPTYADSVRLTIAAVQQVCRAEGRTLYARTWAGEYQDDVRQAIRDYDDPMVWIMNKNVGDPAGHREDWQYMDSHHPEIGALADLCNEMIEFDICGEYLGRSRYTYIMTSYLKEHWNYALDRGADGAVARIDRQGSLPTYTANRIGRYALKEIVANPQASPADINLDWCQIYFPPDAAQDIADHYDAPDSPWDGDTRYMTWAAFYPDLAYNTTPRTTREQALGIGLAALARINRHRAQLELQTTLDTREGKNDYETLRNGIALPVLDLGGTLSSEGFRNFQPTLAGSLTPTCTVQIQVPAPGLSKSSVSCEYSTDAGATWTAWPVTCSGNQGSTALETITAAAVPFGQASATANGIRFHAATEGANPAAFDSGMLTVPTVIGPTWGSLQVTPPRVTNPTCLLDVVAGEAPLNSFVARYCFSKDGGATWFVPPTAWADAYDCGVLPPAAGWQWWEGDGSYASTDGQALRFYDTSTEGGTKVKYYKSWNVNSQTGATVLARMRCASGGHFYSMNIYVGDGVHSEAMYLKANGMVGLCNSGALVPADTQQWHLYRVTIRNQDIAVYYDENPCPLIDAKGAFIQGTGDQRLGIGSGASAGTQDVYYDSIWWTTAGAFPPDPWRPATIDGTGATGTLVADQVPFGQYSDTLNQIRFRLDGPDGRSLLTPAYTVPVRQQGVWADFDADNDVDQDDFGKFQACLSGMANPYPANCRPADADADGDVDSYDLASFRSCLGGANNPPKCE